MGILQSIRPAIAAASLFALGVTASSVSLAPVRAETVDVTKESWWLTPYKASKPWTIGVSYTDTSISYIAALQKAVQAKAKEMGVKIIEVDAKNDTNVELANVESLLQQHIDLLLLEGASLKASVASIEAANKAKVPVVHFNILAEGGEYVTFVGSTRLIPASRWARRSSSSTSRPASLSSRASTCVALPVTSPTRSAIGASKTR